MTITNDAELQAAALHAGVLLQDIQDYVQRTHKDSARVRFPRGFLSTASQQRDRLPFISDLSLKSNIAYTLILSDVQNWLLTRTDISATAKEMLIKLQMFLIGCLVESITKNVLYGKCGGNYARRIAYLEKNEIIDADLHDDLMWVWEMRNKMHLFLLDDSEYVSTDYTVTKHDRAVRAFQKLLEALS